MNELDVLYSSVGLYFQRGPFDKNSTLMMLKYGSSEGGDSPSSVSDRRGFPSLLQRESGKVKIIVAKKRAETKPERLRNFEVTNRPNSNRILQQKGLISGIFN